MTNQITVARNSQANKSTGHRQMGKDKFEVPRFVAIFFSVESAAKGFYLEVMAVLCSSVCLRSGPVAETSFLTVGVTTRV